MGIDRKPYFVESINTSSAQTRSPLLSPHLPLSCVHQGTLTSLPRRRTTGVSTGSVSVRSGPARCLDRRLTDTMQLLAALTSLVSRQTHTDANPSASWTELDTLHGHDDTHSCPLRRAVIGRRQGTWQRQADFWQVCYDRSELGSGRAIGAGTDLDCLDLSIKRSPETLSCFIHRT